MKKIAFIITSNLYVRNYIESNILLSLRGKFNVNLYATNEVDKSGINDDSKSIKYPKYLRYLFSEFNEISTFANINKSKSFKYRVERKYYKSTFLQRIRLNIFRFILAKKFFFLIIKHLLFLLVIFENKVFKRLISFKEYDYVLLPNSGFDPDADITLILAKIYRVKSISLIDNWDNLSSKSVFVFKPNKIFVIGEQSKNHAVEIQGFQPNNIKIIGTPRFEVYKSDYTKSPFNFKYILFAGSNLPFNELDFIKKTLPFLRKYNLKLIYRPHPWRQKNISFNIKDVSKLENVIIDPQLSNISVGSHNLSFQPSLSYYNDLIKNAEFVISPLSTFILESLICKKKIFVIILDTNDMYSYVSPKKAFENYTHFENIDKLSNLFLIDKSEDILGTLEKGFLADYNFLHNKIYNLNYFVRFNNQEKYIDNLINDIENI